ncbi:rop guanine nucleotide exchange factor 9-like [Hibiscus syriacus]|uniref:rop guanine nucleotide exchange factor 9-like n=1 Tax=Hibiscus syriacus TaxID=106335 RepID=UPI001921A73E|nr:rop guanine nucleotide exchange factor 9-like [Hibiscus syriacus]
MVRALTRRYSTHNSGSFRIMRMIESPGRQQQNLIPGGNHHADDVDHNQQEKSTHHQHIGDCCPGTSPERYDMMKEKFAKLLLGEDMSGGGKGVSSALALSNAATNLAASVFGEQVKLGPMAPETKARWRREMDWLLSVTDHIVEFVPSLQKTKNGTNMEEALDRFGEEQEFWYVSKNDDQDNENGHRDDKWWHPTVKVPENGLSETSRRWLQYQKESVNQVLKAAMAINAEILSEMEIPDSYIDSLPGITVDQFDPSQFLATMDLSTEHKVLDLKNRTEASNIIWKRKLHHKDGRSSWGSSVSLEKRELFEVRAETILILLKQRFPGLPQSSLDISKIQYNRVNHANHCTTFLKRTL